MFIDDLEHAKLVEALRDCKLARRRFHDVPLSLRRDDYGDAAKSERIHVLSDAFLGLVVILPKVVTLAVEQYEHTGEHNSSLQCLIFTSLVFPFQCGASYHK